MNIVDGLHVVKGEKTQEGDEAAFFVPADNTVYTNFFVDAGGLEEAIKLSSRFNVHFKHGVIVCGSEDGVDMVRSSNCTFEDVEFRIGRQPPRQFIVCKGPSQHNRFTRLTFKGRPAHGCHIDLGGHTIHFKSDQGTTKDIEVRDCTADARSFSFVRSWNTKGVRVLQNNHRSWLRHLNLPWIAWRPWFWFNDHVHRV